MSDPLFALRNRTERLRIVRHVPVEAQSVPPGLHCHSCGGLGNQAINAPQIGIAAARGVERFTTCPSCQGNGISWMANALRALAT